MSWAGDVASRLGALLWGAVPSVQCTAARVALGMAIAMPMVPPRTCVQIATLLGPATGGGWRARAQGGLRPRLGAGAECGEHPNPFPARARNTSRPTWPTGETLPALAVAGALGRLNRASPPPLAVVPRARLPAPIAGRCVRTKTKRAWHLALDLIPIAIVA